MSGPHIVDMRDMCVYILNVVNIIYIYATIGMEKHPSVLKHCLDHKYSKPYLSGSF